MNRDLSLAIDRINCGLDNSNEERLGVLNNIKEELNNKLDSNAYALRDRLNKEISRVVAKQAINRYILVDRLGGFFTTDNIRYMSDEEISNSFTTNDNFYSTYGVDINSFRDFSKEISTAKKYGSKDIDKIKNNFTSPKNDDYYITKTSRRLYNSYINGIHNASRILSRDIAFGVDQDEYLNTYYTQVDRLNRSIYKVDNIVLNDTRSYLNGEFENNKSKIK